MQEREAFTPLGTISTVQLAERISQETGIQVHPSSIRHFIDKGKIAATWRKKSPIGERGEWRITIEEANRIVQIYKQGEQIPDDEQ